MSTTFSNSRFLAPFIARSQFCLFADFADMLALADPVELFALADDNYAVQVVKQQHVPSETFKMDGQRQSAYATKKLGSALSCGIGRIQETDN